MPSPITPTRVVLGSERDDDGSSAPPPPPASPPTPPTPPPPPPPPASPPAPAGGDWWRGPVPAPAPAGPTPTVIYTQPPAIHVTVQAPGQAPPKRFTWSRLRAGRNASALAVALLARSVANDVLHVMGDQYGVVLAVLAVALVAELRWRGRSWLVRVFSFLMAVVCISTPAGLHTLGWILTGV